MGEGRKLAPAQFQQQACHKNDDDDVNGRRVAVVTLSLLALSVLSV